MNDDPSIHGLKRLIYVYKSWARARMADASRAQIFVTGKVQGVSRRAVVGLPLALFGVDVGGRR